MEGLNLLPSTIKTNGWSPAAMLLAHTTPGKKGVPWPWPLKFPNPTWKKHYLYQHSKIRKIHTITTININLSDWLDSNKHACSTIYLPFIWKEIWWMSDTFHSTSLCHSVFCHSDFCFCDLEVDKILDILYGMIFGNIIVSISLKWMGRGP